MAKVTAGLATGLAPGIATITAALSGITGSATLTVTNPIVSIVVTPANPSIPVAITLQFTATAKYFDNTTADITSTATWTSSNPSVATVSDQMPTKGQARSIAPGTTTIQASSGGVNGSTTLTVTNATLVSIDIAPKRKPVAGQPTAIHGNRPLLRQHHAGHHQYRDLVFVGALGGQHRK